MMERGLTTCGRKRSFFVEGRHVPARTGVELIMKTLRIAAMLALLALNTSACSGDSEDGATTKELEIVGEYDDNFGGEQIITEKDWNGSSIVGYDNDENVVYTQFSDDDQFNPNKFAKTVYTEPKSGSFYFCMVEFSLDSLDEAKQSTASADDSDPDTSGCGGEFAWTKATKK
jgi:hypothetical protein